MSRIPGTPALAGAAWLVALALAAPPARAQATEPVAPDNRPAAIGSGSGRCGVCHPRERVAFEQSQHAREDVRCVSCHGGNDGSLEKAVAHGGGFTALSNRAAIPTLCGSCHSSLERMRAYNLPVDQFALYQTSAHGLRLKTGDTRVAVCSDCHGAHDILPPSDPASRVYVTNIPRTCGQCHGDSTLVRQRHIPDVYREYLSSTHARELLERGNLRAPTCVSCHGVHGATPPRTGDVNKVCGQCHTSDRRYFLAGSHRDAMAAQNISECASCHGDHAVAAVDPARLGQVCAQCHDAAGHEAKLGAQLLADYRNAQEEVRKADELIARADQVPIQTDDYKARLEEARTYLREALTATHSVQPELVSGFTLRARSVGSEIQSEIIDKLGNIRTAKLLLILFWFYVLVTAGILRRIRNRRPPAR